MGAYSKRQAGGQQAAGRRLSSSSGKQAIYSVSMAAAAEGVIKRKRM